ncbi:hypothetical protein ABKN59_002918 [Abortiporus biennis]
MATALQLPSPDHGPSINDIPSMGYPQQQSSSELYSRRLTLTDLDLKDTRYPTLNGASNSMSPSTSTGRPFSDRFEDGPMTDMPRRSWVDYPQQTSSYMSSGWIADKLTEEPMEQRHIQQHSSQSQQEIRQSPVPSQLQTPSQMRSYNTLPPGSASPYGFNGQEERISRMPSNDGGSAERRVESNPVVNQHTVDMGQRSSQVDQYCDSPVSMQQGSPSFNPASMAIPISPTPRAYAQQPTFINPSSNNPKYIPQQVPKEEICVECAMRDQDMADVDVTSPGIWERESDAMYDDLCRREQEEEASGISHSDSSGRPRAKGDPLSESNLKYWLSINPKEPSSRLQTLDQYVRSQRGLLEAEALAHARAMRESRILDDRMRDAYSQLRRSAYELGSSAQATDDSGGIRIKAPQAPHSPAMPSHLATNGHNREMTLLQNGMIVEHVDIQKEEREERERRRKEERREKSRARKSSRSSRSGADVTSVYSLQYPPQPTDSGFFSGIRPDSRYSQSVNVRPNSVFTTGGERPQTLLRAQSQASFSDMQSIMSAGTSPRRSRFFGFKNLSSSWRSQESFAPSGSMVDMHVALQREQQYLQSLPNAVDIGSNAPTLRMDDTWRQSGVPPQPDSHKEGGESRPTKKAKGFKKIWKIVTGSSSKSDAHGSSRCASGSADRTDDDQPLAPPPPLSYLVNHQGSGLSSRRLMPSPTSSRPSGADNSNEIPKPSGLNHEYDDHMPSSDSQLPESDSRGRTTRSSSRTLSSLNGPVTPATTPSLRPASAALRRDKSLPPLPGESSVEFPNHPMPDSRPQTLFTYDPRGFPMSGADTLAPPQAGFRISETRRQSFGGVASGPHPAIRSLPARGPFARDQVNVPPFLAEEKYSEFGVSRNSIGQWARAQYSQPSLQIPVETTTKKRKSKFGLSSLFGKKSQGVIPTEALDYTGYRTSNSDSRFDGMPGGHSGYASPLSGHSSTMPRMSVASHRNLDLVDQDRDFVAYRYPSADQQVQVLR